MGKNTICYFGIEYMEIFNPGWNLNSLNRVEILSRLNSKLLFKLALQLHVKISIQCTELKFELGFANPRWIFNLGRKFQISHIIEIFSNPGWKFATTHAWIPCLFLKKVGDFTRTFQMDRWQTYQSYKIFARIGQLVHSHSWILMVFHGCKDLKL